MEMARPRLGGPESGVANTQDVARLEFPFTGGRPNHRGLESGAACNQDVARWERPYTNNGQSCVVRGRG